MMECASCGTLQAVPRGGESATLVCVQCGSELQGGSERGQRLALGCALAALVLFVPANTLPFLTTSVFAATRTSLLASAVSSMVKDGWPTLAMIIGFVVIVAPFLRFTLLAVVLGSLELGWKPPWLGPAFRWASWLQDWAMTDVLLLGLWVAYERLDATVPTTLEIGGVCFIVVGLLTLVLGATLDRATVWRCIMPESETVDGAVLACGACGRVAPVHDAGGPCVRCGARLHLRRPHAVSRTAALVIASAILYVPANLFPMATLPIHLQLVSYTVIGGVRDLIDVRMFGLALLVFVASFAIPLLKLAGLGWCVTSVLSRSRRRLRLKTRLYHLVDGIGRWSMVDPLVLSCFVPVSQYNAALSSRAEPAAPAFTAVVLLTVIAARAFDPRLMWDAARERHHE